MLSEIANWTLPSCKHAGSTESESMRILYTHRGYFPALAGAEAMTYLVAETMHRRGHTVTILCQSTDGTIQRRRRDDVDVVGVPSWEPPLLRAVVDGQPDIVHAVDAVWPNVPQASLALARDLGVPFVFTPASAISTWHDVPAILAICRSADVVCALTETERALFQQQGVAAERLLVIGQGLHLVGTPDPLAFCARHAITGPMVLYLGRKVYFKGYQLLLAASRLVWTHYPDTQFVFIGPRCDPDSAAIFRSYADRRILELGQVDEVEKHSALTACAICCLPSQAEVFPLVYVEAWACRKPVIAGPFPGVEEIVRHEQDGLIVPADPTALAHAITQLLDDPAARTAMGEAGYQRVRRQFTWEVVTDHIVGAYLQLFNSMSA
jgi:glycosyltransferase involved in cell wall biosynthesis